MVKKGKEDSQRGQQQGFIGHPHRRASSLLGCQPRRALSMQIQPILLEGGVRGGTEGRTNQGKVGGGSQRTRKLTNHRTQEGIPQNSAKSPDALSGTFWRQGEASE